MEENRCYTKVTCKQPYDKKERTVGLSYSFAGGKMSVRMIKYNKFEENRGKPDESVSIFQNI